MLCSSHHMIVCFVYREATATPFFSGKCYSIIHTTSTRLNGRGNQEGSLQRHVGNSAWKVDADKIALFYCNINKSLLWSGLDKTATGARERIQKCTGVCINSPKK